ncbi:ATP-dependent Clp protease proteolytic subunit [compost metagenome]
MSNEIKIEEMFMPSTGAVRERSFPTKIYTLYLDDVIGAPSEYRDHMEALEAANEWDDVRVVISSPGGRLDAGLMLINGIKSCRAPVTAHIHEQCGSMATGIALACQNWMLGDFAYFFVHTASWGTWGKDSEIRSQVQFMDKRIDKFLHEMYDGFLDEEEIRLVGKGQDMWIEAEELRERLENYQEVRAEQQGCGNPDCQECGIHEEDEDAKPFSLEDVISDAVAEGVQKGLDKILKKYELVEKPKKASSKKKPAPLDENKELSDYLERQDAKAD